MFDARAFKREAIGKEILHHLQSPKMPASSATDPGGDVPRPLGNLLVERDRLWLNVRIGDDQENKKREVVIRTIGSCLLS